jgi:2-polyprenyl-3-methyl-5-hydroxy-6-metoxy-1,4-benzoquinol methylase
MDDPALPARELQAALRGLKLVNRLSRSASILWPAIRRLALESTTSQPLKVLDIACGGGDVTWQIARSAQRQNLPIQIEGCDINPLAVEYSTNAAGASEKLPVRFFPLNVLRENLPQGYDVLMCSLFLHHLKNDEAKGLLSRMGESARRMVLVNDLRRTRLGYALAYAGSRLLSRSPIVHYDGPQSVRAAFTSEEIRNLALEAGLSGATITNRWPQRYLLSWSKPP